MLTETRGRIKQGAGHHRDAAPPRGTRAEKASGTDSLTGAGQERDSRGEACAYLTHRVRWLFTAVDRSISTVFKAGWVAASTVTKLVTVRRVEAVRLGATERESGSRESGDSYYYIFLGNTP
jgi:hypothetical protein